MSHTFALNDNFSTSGQKFGPDSAGDFMMRRSVFAENFVLTMSDIWSATQLPRLCSPKDACIGLDFSKEYLKKNGYLQMYTDYLGMYKHFYARQMSAELSNFKYSEIEGGRWRDYTPEQISDMIELSGHLPMVYDLYEISGRAFDKPVPFGHEDWWFNGYSDLFKRTIEPTYNVADGQWKIINPFMQKDYPIWQWGWSAWDWSEVSANDFEDSVRACQNGYPYSHSYYDFDKMICDHSTYHHDYINCPVLPYLTAVEHDMFGGETGLSDFEKSKYYNYLDLNFMSYYDKLSVGFNTDFNENGYLCVITAVSCCGVPSVEISSYCPFKWSWLEKPVMLPNGDMQTWDMKLPLRFVKEQIQSEALVANEAHEEPVLGVSEHKFECPHLTKGVGGWLVYKLSADWTRDDGKSSTSCNISLTSRYVNKTSDWELMSAPEQNKIVAWRQRDKASMQFPVFGDLKWYKHLGDLSSWCTTEIDLHTGRATILIHFDPNDLSSRYPERIDEYYNALKGLLSYSTEEQRRRDLQILMEWYEGECNRISSEISVKQEELTAVAESLHSREYDLSGMSIVDTITNYYSNSGMVYVMSWDDYKTYWEYDPMVSWRDMPDGYFPDSIQTKLEREYVFLNDVSPLLRMSIYDNDPSFWNLYSGEYWYMLTSESDVDYLVQTINDNMRYDDMDSLRNVCTNVIRNCYDTTYNLTASFSMHSDISDFIMYQEYYWPLPFASYLTSQYENYTYNDLQYLDLILQSAYIETEITELNEEQLSVDEQYSEEYLHILTSDYPVQHPEYSTISCLVHEWWRGGPTKYEEELTCVTGVTTVVPADEMLSTGFPEGFADVYPTAAFPANDFLSTDSSCISLSLMRFATLNTSILKGDVSKGEELSSEEHSYVKNLQSHSMMYNLQSDGMNGSLWSKAKDSGITYNGYNKDMFAGQVPQSFIDYAKGTQLTTIVGGWDIKDAEVTYEEYWYGQNAVTFDVSCDNGDFWESLMVLMKWIDRSSQLPIGPSWLNGNIGDMYYSNDNWYYGKTFLSTDDMEYHFELPEDMRPPVLSAIDYCVESNESMQIKEAPYQFQTVDFLNLITRA